MRVYLKPLQNVHVRTRRCLYMYPIMTVSARQDGQKGRFMADRENLENARNAHHEIIPSQELGAHVTVILRQKVLHGFFSTKPTMLKTGQHTKLGKTPMGVLYEAPPVPLNKAISGWMVEIWN